MKRYVSVFEMIVRSSIYKVLLIVVGMIAVETVFFYQTLMNPQGVNLELYIDQSQYSLIFKIAYVLVTIVILLPGRNRGSVQSYTLQRLRIKEKYLFWLQALYNVLAYVILWGVQLVMLFVSAALYRKYLPASAIWTNQTLFLAFHRNDFMHSIFPLEDIYGIVLLLFMLIVPAVTAAAFTKLQRRGKFVWEIFVVVTTVMIAFPRFLAQDITFVVMVTLFIGVCALMRWSIYREVEKNEG